MTVQSRLRYDVDVAVGASGASVELAHQFRHVEERQQQYTLPFKLAALHIDGNLEAVGVEWCKRRVAIAHECSMWIR